MLKLVTTVLINNYYLSNIQRDGHQVDKKEYAGDETYNKQPVSGYSKWISFIKLITSIRLVVHIGGCDFLCFDWLPVSTDSSSN